MERVHYDATGVVTAPALIGQEYFWALATDDPDPTTYAVNCPMVLTGALDRAALQRAAAAFVNGHSVFRTSLREIEGRLCQVVLPPHEAPVFELELEDRPLPSGDADAEAAEIERACNELAARGFDLARGRVLWAKLVTVAPERHLLVAVLHHVAGDRASNIRMFRRLSELYLEACTGEPSEPPSLQLIDVAEAVRRWSQSSTGVARTRHWRDRLRDAPAVEVPLDVSREEVRRGRPPARHGITADQMYSPEIVTLEPAIHQACAAAARTHKVTMYTVFVAGVAWLLHERTRQADICLETSVDRRALDPALASVMGLLSQWTALRIDLAGCTSFADTLARAGQAIAEVRKYGPIEDYYDIVRPELRRVTINYLPTRFVDKPACTSGLQMQTIRMPFPPWKRPWELHVTILDGAQTTLVWTANQVLFQPQTMRALLDRYLAILASANG